MMPVVMATPKRNLDEPNPGGPYLAAGVSFGSPRPTNTGPTPRSAASRAQRIGSLPDSTDAPCPPEVGTRGHLHREVRPYSLPELVEFGLRAQVAEQWAYEFCGHVSGLVDELFSARPAGVA